MEKNNWQDKTIIFSFIAIEGLLLLISMIAAVFSGDFVFSRQYKTSDRHLGEEVSIATIEGLKSSILYRGENTLEEVFLLDSKQVHFQQEIDNLLVDRHSMVSIDSEQTKLTQISRNSLWEIDSLIILLVLGLILFRVNQQIHNQYRLNQESSELNRSETQSPEN